MLNYPEKYLQDVLVRFAYNSNAIEGNTLTLGQTQAIILNQTVTVTGTKGKTLKEIYEADNQKDAFNQLMYLAANNQALDVDTILDFHFRLTKNTIGTAGRFKSSENAIVGANFQTVSPAMAGIEVKQWVENLNYRLDNAQNQQEILEILMETHISFEQLHPFDDGNGRTGREIINFELVKYEMPFLIIEKDDRPTYMQMLADSSVSGLTAYANEKLINEQKRYEIFCK